MIDRTGQLLGNYRLIRRLGYGSFAEVYLGEHIYLNMLTAIKILRQPMTNSDSGDFLTEARTLAQLRHPHIVQILDFGIEDESPYLVMEYAPHGTLRHRYPKGTILPLPTVISYVKQIAAALQYAHDHEFIHRDVKPDNILLGANEQILLSDFGLALLAAHSLLYKNIEGIAGTFAYMAPEQLQGKVYRASDQYALGIVVYEWLCGERPFRGSHREVAAQQEFALPPPFYEKQEVERVVLKALAKAPHERFASIQVFAQALEEAGAEGQSLRTVPVDVRKPSAENEPLPNGKLPILFTSLIGREQEVIAVRTLLARPQIRLVTLLGPGGIGKTRLSLQVATEAEDHFADGVYFVPLAPIVDPTLVIPILAQVLGIKENGVQTPLEQVKDALQNKQLLLILDNVEQVVEAGAVVEDLLAACPKLKVVVTSRALLHLQAEHVFQVLPLALPDPKQMSDGIALSHYGAVALFVQRAQTILPTFEVTEANVHILVEICRRLDGLPLAIELAAARIRLLPPQALLARLSQRLHVLTGGSHTLPSRQQTLRNTIMWSYNLLNPVEQQLFRRLAVFVGGWTLEGAEAVLYTSHAVGETALGILDGIASLLDKSLLLLQIEQEGEEPHLIMLETIREYGLEVLVASGEMESVRQTHARYYLLIAEETEPKPEGSPQHIKWLRKLDREYDNIRAAMQWALEQKKAGHGGEMALRFGGALRRFWLARNYWSEGLQFLKSALSALSEDEKVAKSVRAKALIATAQLLLKHGDYEQGKVLAKESVELYRELQETAGLAVALSLLGSITLRGDNYGIARSLLEEALALFKKVGDQENAAWSLFDLGILSIEQGNYSEGRAFFEETLHIHREQKNKSGIAAALLRLGWLMYYSQGDPIQERSLLEESLALFRELVDKEHIADALYTLGLVVLQQNEVLLAQTFAQESLAIFKEMGQRPGIAESLLLQARIAATRGDYMEACALYQESVAFCREKGDQWNIAMNLEGIACVVVTQGEQRWAAHLLGAAEALRESIGGPLPLIYRAEYEQAVEAVRTQLGEKAFIAAWTEGRTMTPKEALAARIPTTKAPLEEAVPVSTRKSTRAYPAGLTRREGEILRLVAQGLTNGQVAEQLVISPRTVDTHLTSIYSKIEVSSRSGATRYAAQHHLI